MTMLLSAAVLSAPRSVSWWWYGTGSNANATALLSFVAQNKDIVSSVMLYCGFGVRHDGTIGGNLSEPCVQAIPGLRQQGVGVELWLGEEDSLDAVKRLFASPQRAATALAAAVKTHGLSGINVDLEAHSSNAYDAAAFGTFLRAIRPAVNAAGARLTVDVAPFTSLLADMGAYQDAVDRVLYMHTYFAGSLREWTEYLQPALNESSLPRSKLGAGLAVYRDSKTAGWADTAAAASERLCYLENASVTEVDLFRIDVSFKWPDDFWLAPLRAFASGQACAPPPLPKDSCPPGWIGPDSQGCCDISASSGCSEACAKKDCASFDAGSWWWKPLDYHHHPFTCCPPNTTTLNAATLSPHEPAPARSMQLPPEPVVAVGEARPLDGDHFIGYNVVNLQSGNFTDPGYTNGTALAGAGLLRYPGGNLADFWDWRTGWCVAAATAVGCDKCTNPCKGKRRRLYSLAEFGGALRATGARAVLMVNMLTSTLDEQLAYLAHAAQIGVLGAGTYVELGGEFYWGQFAGRWPRATDYARDANAWADAIKKQHPTSRVMAVAAFCTAWGRAPPTYRGAAWNDELYAVLGASVDGVTMHPYLHLGDDEAGGGPLQPSVPPRAPGEGPSGWGPPAAQRAAVDEVLGTTNGTELLLGIPFFLSTMTQQANVATRAALPARLRLLVTEWNLMERAGPVKLSWAHALMAATATLVMLGVAQLDGTLLHVLLNGFGWGALYETSHDLEYGGTPPAGSAATALGKGDGCVIPECTGLATTPYRPTAVGTALGQVAGALGGAVHARRLAFASNPTRHGALPGGLPGTAAYPSLLGWALRDGVGRERAVVLNLSPGEIFANVTCSGGYTTLTSPSAAGALASWAADDAPVRGQHGECDRDPAGLTLLPFSITTLDEVDASRLERRQRA